MFFRVWRYVIRLPFNYPALNARVSPQIAGCFAESAEGSVMIKWMAEEGILAQRLPFPSSPSLSFGSGQFRLIYVGFDRGNNFALLLFGCTRYGGRKGWLVDRETQTATVFLNKLDMRVNGA